MSSTALKDANYFGEEFGGKGEGGMYKPQYRISEGFFFCDQFISKLTWTQSESMVFSARLLNIFKLLWIILYFVISDTRIVKLSLHMMTDLKA